MESGQAPITQIYSLHRSTRPQASVSPALAKTLARYNSFGVWWSTRHFDATELFIYRAQRMTLGTFNRKKDFQASVTVCARWDRFSVHALMIVVVRDCITVYGQRDLQQFLFKSNG